MSSVAIAGDTSGSVTLQAPAVAGTTVLTLPATSGTVLAPTGGTLTAAQGGTGLTTAGTSGNVLTSDGTNWTSAAGGGMTLLGTLITTSGTSAVISGLNLTNYKQLNIIYNNVSFTGTATITLNTIAITASIASTGNGNWGQTIVDLNVGTFWTLIYGATATSGTVTATGNNNAGGNCGVTTAATTLTFAGGTFDAGTIYVYGMK